MYAGRRVIVCWLSLSLLSFNGDSRCAIPGQTMVLSSMVQRQLANGLQDDDLFFFWFKFSPFSFCLVSQDSFEVQRGLWCCAVADLTPLLSAVTHPAFDWEKR